MNNAVRRTEQWNITWIWASLYAAMEHFKGQFITCSSKDWQYGKFLSEYMQEMMRIYYVTKPMKSMKLRKAAPKAPEKP